MVLKYASASKIKTCFQLQFFSIKVYKKKSNTTQHNCVNKGTVDLLQTVQLHDSEALYVMYSSFCVFK